MQTWDEVEKNANPDEFFYRRSVIYFADASGKSNPL